MGTGDFLIIYYNNHMK